MSTPRSRLMLISIVCAALLVVMALFFFTDEGSKASENIKVVEDSRTVQNDVPVDQAGVVKSDGAKTILVLLDEVKDADILLDVSEDSKTHIPGSVVIPFTEFETQAGVLKPVSEIARILGDAGVSRDDSVVTYGECLPCGGGPSVATYVYWIMKSLGHEKVLVLNETVEDWEAMGRDSTKDARKLPGRVYTPAETANYTATYEFVKSGQAQIVDARTLQEFMAQTIPGSISIPYENVLDGKKIKSMDELNKVFAALDKDKPVVVFTYTGMKASVVWFALEMMGYDVRLYSYKDWMENEQS
jgi:thiosulfate/3-mercaptopyruvate sulfurtransferase